MRLSSARVDTPMYMRSRFNLHTEVRLRGIGGLLRSSRGRDVAGAHAGSRFGRHIRAVDCSASQARGLAL
jgi:hypothetical protein